MRRRVALVFVLAAAVLGTLTAPLGPGAGVVAAQDAPPAGSEPGGSGEGDTVRLVIDDPAVAAAVAEQVPEAEVALSTNLFAAVEVPADEVDEVRSLALAEGAGNVEEDVEVRLVNAEPVGPGPAAISPNDPYFAQSAGLSQLRLPDAWSATLGDPSTVIAIIDTGVAEVPELTGRLLPGRSYVPGRAARVAVADPNDDSHGTMSAVVAAGAANNATASVGACPRCTVLPVRVFANTSSTASLSVVAAAIEWATDNGADVISMSLAGTSSLAALEDAVRRAESAGVLLVGAAGNEGSTTRQYPAALPEVLAVGAITDGGALYSFSNRGSWVGYAASGCNWSMDDAGAIRRYCGTSSATPLLAGALGVYRTIFPTPTAAQVRADTAAVSTAVPGIGGGYPNVQALISFPIGSVDLVRQYGPAAIQVAGWALDPDTADPISIEVVVDGSVRIRTTAGVARADVASAYPTAGPAHGFSQVVPAAPGNRRVCIRAVNVGAGTGTSTVACRNVEVRSGVPVGNLEAAAQRGPRTVRVSGWGLDYDTTNPVAVHVYVNGRYAGATTAQNLRGDVAAAYPGYGASRGYTRDVVAPAGRNEVCVYAINQPAGTNPLLGCRTVTVRSGTPIGTLDRVEVASAGRARVQGWSLDFDTRASTRVHIYVDGRFRADRLADTTRRDIDRAYPGYGAAHGYDATVRAARGSTVCAYAINAAGAGANALLGCGRVP